MHVVIYVNARLPRFFLFFLTLGDPLLFIPRTVINCRPISPLIHPTKPVEYDYGSMSQGIRHK